MTEYPAMVTIHEVTALRAEVARLTSENALLREPFDGVYLQGADLEAARVIAKWVGHVIKHADAVLEREAK